MILVTLGTQDNSFERLLKEIEHLIETGIIQEKVIVQAGNTKFESNKMKIIDFVSQKELEEFINKASYIITHGGVGSITEALKQNKKIIGIQDIEELEKAIKIIPNFKPNKYKTNTQNIIKIIENFIG